jgi:hypothetical protein
VTEGKEKDTELSAGEQVDRIIEAADKLGVEVDETDATQWLTSMAAAQAAPGDFAVDAQTGIFGHRITLLDFDPQVLERYRHIADIVQLPDQPGVQTAISLSGSAAQSKVQLFPGDADYFERVNIQAPTREEACRILADIMRTKALDKLKGDDYELVYVRWGSYLQDVVKGGEEIKVGGSIVWTAQEVQDGRFDVFTPEGEPMTIDWEYGCQDPGWCKLDWVIAEPERGRVVHTSNMLDVTWEAPDGTIVPLDGYLDPYFQEVYLEAESIPVFTKLVKHLSPDALHDYVGALKEQVSHYSRKDPANYGKVAKRLYNIFRLTGRWQEAAFVRELFDEPAALLYQVASLLDTVDEAVATGDVLDHDTLIDQVDDLLRSVVRVLEGPEEEQIVDMLLQLRDHLSGRRDLGEARDDLVAESVHVISSLVSDYFRERLFLMPEIVAYLESLP